MTKIDDILDKVWKSKIQSDEAKQALLTDLLELVGEDEERKLNDEDWLDYGKLCSNAIRAELRQKIREYCK